MNTIETIYKWLTEGHVENIIPAGDSNLGSKVLGNRNGYDGNPTRHSKLGSSKSLRDKIAERIRERRRTNPVLKGMLNPSPTRKNPATITCISEDPSAVKLFGSQIESIGHKSDKPFIKKGLKSINNTITRNAIDDVIHNKVKRPRRIMGIKIGEKEEPEYPEFAGYKRFGSGRVIPEYVKNTQLRYFRPLSGDDEGITQFQSGNLADIMTRDPSFSVYSHGW